MGMLCASGLTTMGELLDVRGPWDLELIETMMPVAVEHEIRQTELIYRGVHAAIFASMGKNGAEKVEQEKERMFTAVRDAQREVRGLQKLGDLPGAPDAVDRFMQTMSRDMKISPGRQRRPFKVPQVVKDQHSRRG